MSLLTKINQRLPFSVLLLKRSLSITKKLNYEIHKSPPNDTKSSQRRDILSIQAITNFGIVCPNREGKLYIECASDMQLAGVSSRKYKRALLPIDGKQAEAERKHFKIAMHTFRVTSI